MAVVVELLYQLMSATIMGLIHFRREQYYNVETAWRRFLYRLGMAQLYTAIAFTVVYLVPSCSGSGIPETKVGR